VTYRIIIGAIAVGALSACSLTGSTKRAANPFDVTLDSSCYTVDLFTKPNFVTPSKDVPARWRDFAGVWGGGAWNGRWCHDLYVLEVQPDGLVRLIETHAPYEPWGKRATAFQRTGRIGPDGRLRLRYGQTRSEYWVEDGRLYGLQTDDGAQRKIALNRQPV
jgi:hypothetical protein